MLLSRELLLLLCVGLVNGLYHNHELEGFASSNFADANITEKRMMQAIMEKNPSPGKHLKKGGTLKKKNATEPLKACFEDKCGPGGKNEATQDSSAPGGNNKGATDPLLSSHSYLHKKAAEMANEAAKKIYVRDGSNYTISLKMLGPARGTQMQHLIISGGLEGPIHSIILNQTSDALGNSLALAPIHLDSLSPMLKLEGLSPGNLPFSRLNINPIRVASVRILPLADQEMPITGPQQVQWSHRYQTVGTSIM
ncbi:hypothetical protein Chor_011575 [Crotalus horridus]